MYIYSTLSNDDSDIRIIINCAIWPKENYMYAVIIKKCFGQVECLMSLSKTFYLGDISSNNGSLFPYP